MAKISDCGYDHVLQVADLAMYYAKASGGGAVVYGPDRSPVAAPPTPMSAIHQPPIAA